MCIRDSPNIIKWLSQLFWMVALHKSCQLLLAIFQLNAGVQQGSAISCYSIFSLQNKHVLPFTGKAEGPFKATNGFTTFHRILQHLEDFCKCGQNPNLCFHLQQDTIWITSFNLQSTLAFLQKPEACLHISLCDAQLQTKLVTIYQTNNRPSPHMNLDPPSSHQQWSLIYRRDTQLYLHLSLIHI